MSSSPSEPAFFASCPRGLEALLASELTALGAAAPVTVPGGVHFTGEWDVCYRANLWSRLASRVLWRVATFAYRTADDVYAAAHGVEWPALFDVQQTLRVQVGAHRSPLASLEFATLRVKDAVCDRFRAHTGRRPTIDKARPGVRVHAHLEADQGSLYLDTSGEALFKRGWRRDAVDAPLRENLAAGIVLLSGWTPEQTLLDPMCGGATFLVEAAAIARRRAPGARRRFGFERLRTFQAARWRELQAEAGERASGTGTPDIHGSDIDPRALAAARRNLAAAGVERWVRLEQGDVRSRPAPASQGVMLCNPPYGERLGSADALARFYPELGTALKRQFTGWRCHLFSADRRLPALMRLTPSRRVPLYNGALECRLYEFRMVTGSHRPRAARTQ